MPEEADMAISMLDGRVFSNKKVMKAATWDGKEKFKVRFNELLFSFIWTIFHQIQPTI